MKRVKLISEYRPFLKNKFFEKLSGENQQALTPENFYPLNFSENISVESLLKMNLTKTSDLQTEHLESIITVEKISEEMSGFYNQDLRTKNENLEKLQEELINQNENLKTLQLTLINRQASLVSQEIELTRSNQYLTDFANMTSHDLKEPLRNIKLFAQLLAKRYKNKLDTDADEFFGYITSGVDQMEKLIGSILDYAKLNKLDVPLENTSSQISLEAAKMNLIFAIQESSAVITNDHLPTIKINSVQLTQVFQNLLSNAMKYRSPLTPSKIHIGAEKKAGTWFFCVIDNGIGIPPEDFEKIFLPFHRLHNNRNYEGIGLGLSFCKKTIERYGGEMWFESNEGEGSKAFFTFPVA